MSTGAVRVLIEWLVIVAVVVCVLLLLEARRCWAVIVIEIVARMEIIVESLLCQCRCHRCSSCCAASRVLNVKVIVVNVTGVNVAEFQLGCKLVRWLAQQIPSRVLVALEGGKRVPLYVRWFEPAGLEKDAHALAEHLALLQVPLPSGPFKHVRLCSVNGAEVRHPGLVERLQIGGGPEHVAADVHLEPVERLLVPLRHAPPARIKIQIFGQRVHAEKMEMNCEKKKKKKNLT